MRKLLEIRRERYHNGNQLRFENAVLLLDKLNTPKRPTPCQRPNYFSQLRVFFSNPRER